ncbi:MAG TPA: glycosyltransferase [Ignavibacteria bacterium]|nr:glycosyltransferase [Ignavibacteria bacterium]
MSDKLVSIIIPTYNDSENLTGAINSCLNQTYKNIEILICDDGSNDKTPEIVAKYKEKHTNKIKYYKLEHLESPAIARNIGIKNAKGEFISFLDSDDLMMENKIEKQVRFLENNPFIDIVCSNATKFNDAKDELFYKKQSHEEKISFKKLLENNNIINSTVLIRKTAIENIGLLYERKYYLKNIKKFFYEDYEYWLRALLLNKNIFYSPEILIKYRISNKGISQNSSEEKRIVGLINTLKILLKTKKGGVLKKISIINKILFNKRFLYKIKIKNKLRL